ncbi:MAG: hypothetical protein ACOC9Q_03545 [bacterium]
MVQLDFGRQSRRGRDELVSNVRNVNAYVEDQGKDGKSPLPVYVCPGLTRWDSGDFDGAIRGAQKNGGTALYTVLGNEVVKFSDSGSGTKIGGLIGADKVFMAINQASDPEIAVVTEDNQYYVIDTDDDSIALSTASNLPNVSSVTSLDGYLIFSEARSARIWHTDQNDANTVGATAFATAESASDNLARVFAHNGFLYALGEESVEIWRNVGTSPFAFAPEDADIDVGCIAPHSVVEVTGGREGQEGLCWVDNYGCVRFMRGNAHGVISTNTVSRAIEELTDGERAAIEGWRYWHQGHEFLSLKSAQWTWEYDFSTGVWHERESQGLNRWRAQGFADFAGLNLVGNETDGKLYEIDPEAFDEDGDAIIFAAVSGPVHDFPNHLIGSALEIDMITGVANASESDPEVMIDVSKNGGKTWTKQYVRSLGGVGEYSKRIRVNRLGRANEKGFTFRISASSKVLRGIMIADLQVEQVRDQ